MKLPLPELLVISLIAGTTSLPAQSCHIQDLGAVPGQSVSAGYGLNAKAKVKIILRRRAAANRLVAPQPAIGRAWSLYCFWPLSLIGKPSFR